MAERPTSLPPGGASRKGETPTAKGLIATVIGPQIDRDSLDDLRAELDRARHETEMGLLPEAAEIVRKIITALEGRTRSSRDPSKAELLRANSYAVLGDIELMLHGGDRAAPSFARAAELIEGGLVALAELEVTDLTTYGMALVGVGRWTEAVAILSEVVARGAKTALVCRYLGRAFLGDGSYDQAEGWFRQALALDPVDPLTQRQLAEAVRAQPGRRHEAVDLYCDAGYAYATRGQFDAGLASFDEASALDPSSSRPRAAKADALRAMGRLDEARSEIQHALTVGPDEPVALAVHAAILRQLGRLGEALDAVERALQLLPGNDVLLDSKASLLVLLGRLPDALETLEIALAVSVNGFRLAAKAAVLEQLSHPEEAAETLRRALDADPEHASTFLAQRGELLRQLGRYEDALRVLEKALELSPNDAYVWGTKGQVFRQLGQPEGALEALNKAVALDGRMAWVWTELGETLRILDRNDDALQALDRALELVPNDSWTLATKGQVLAALDRHEEAVGILQTVWNGDTDRRWVCHQLVFSLLALGRDDSAMELLDGLIEAAEGDAVALGIKGRLLAARGQHEQAVGLLRRAVHLESGLLSWWVDLGDSLLVLGRLHEALAALDEVPAQFAEDGEILAVRGRVLHGLQRYEEAVSTLNRAIELGVESADVYAELGAALLALNRPGEALREVDRALGLQPASAWTLGVRSTALHSLERYDEALASADAALELNPHDFLARVSKAGLLCQFGEFEQALRLLDDSAAEESGEAWIWGLKGWALHNLGSPVLAREAWEAALTYEEVPVFRNGLADALFALGQTDAAAEQYRRTIQLIQDDPEQMDDEGLSHAGWAHYRLGDHSEAIKHYTESLSLYPKSIAVRFDLALALLGARQEGLAAETYQRACEEARLGHPRRRLGLLHVARVDFDEALRAGQAGAEGPERTGIDELLASELRAARERLLAPAETR